MCDQLNTPPLLSVFRIYDTQCPHMSSIPASTKLFALSSLLTQLQHLHKSDLRIVATEVFRQQTEEREERELEDRRASRYTESLTEQARRRQQRQEALQRERDENWPSLTGGPSPNHQSHSHARNGVIYSQHQQHTWAQASPHSNNRPRTIPE